MTTPRPASTVISRRRASAKYRERNEDELREKARQRMARLRQRRMEDVDLAKTARAWACEDSKKYREKYVNIHSIIPTTENIEYGPGTPTLSLTENGLHVWRSLSKSTGPMRGLSGRRNWKTNGARLKKLQEWRGYEEQYQSALKTHEETKAAAETLRSLGTGHR
ncbi:hypothetical protein B0H11DRAFT_1925028 [Mycena galericulata]|nr:hypothetical protein B0H11DRAFT_1925028 [Mycena galericulata]